MYRYWVARFEVLTVVLLMIHVFRGVTLCHWINSSHHFEGNVVFRICGTVSPVPHCKGPEDLYLPSKCHYLSAKGHDHIFHTSTSPWCVVCFIDLLGKLYLFLYFFHCYYYSWCTVILYLLYIDAWWFLPVNCCQKRGKIVSDSHERKNFLILCYACSFMLRCWWFDTVWQDALHGGNSNLLEKCFSSDHDGSSNCSRKCFFVVLLLCIWTAVSFCMYVHMCKLTCLRVETWSLRSNENPCLYSVFFLV